MSPILRITHRKHISRSLQNIARMRAIKYALSLINKSINIHSWRQTRPRCPPAQEQAKAQKLSCAFNSSWGKKDKRTVARLSPAYFLRARYIIQRASDGDLRKFPCSRFYGGKEVGRVSRAYFIVCWHGAAGRRVVKAASYMDIGRKTAGSSTNQFPDSA